MKANRKKLHIRDALAVNAAKAADLAGHLTGHQGTALPGKTALMIAPSVLKDLAGQVRRTTFAVCGTNGKTTVNNLLCAMLEAEGNSVVCNRLGANMLNGITAAFAQAADRSGMLDADYACLEVDEASALRVFSYVRPDYLILTNLFRDQLDRYGEIDIIMGKLEEAISRTPDLKLIINADDPLSVYLAQKTKHPYICYGLRNAAQKEMPDRERAPDREQAQVREQAPGLSGEKETAYLSAEESVLNFTHVRDGRFCKNCGALLHYPSCFYSQMGIWHCPGCGFSRPVPAYEASGIVSQNGLAFSINNCAVRTDMRGLYSVYNVLAVWSALEEDGHFPLLYGGILFNRILSKYHPQFGRSETFRINGQNVFLNLAKNPAGFNQNIAAVMEDRAPKDLIIAINDNDQDGTDISWLWDVDFDRLREESVQSVTVSGIRALDMQLRLKYAGIFSKRARSTEEAVKEKLADGCGNLYVLVNYTALFSVHLYLKRLSAHSYRREQII